MCAADGAVYVADSGVSSVFRASGTDVSIVAGIGREKGISEPSGDGGAATDAPMRCPVGVAVSGSDLYISDYESCCIRRVNADGIISTIAGGAGGGSVAADGQSALADCLYNAGSLVAEADGSLLVAQRGGDLPFHRIRRIHPDGTISTVIGNGEKGHDGDGGPATEARIYRPEGLAKGPDGSIYFTEGWGYVRRVDADGIITTVAGRDGKRGPINDGDAALSARLWLSGVMAVDDDGSVLFGANGGIWELRPDGTIWRFAGGDRAGDVSDGIALAEARAARATSLVYTSDGGLLVLDAGALCVYELQQATPDITRQPTLAAVGRRSEERFTMLQAQREEEETVRREQARAALEAREPKPVHMEPVADLPDLADALAGRPLKVLSDWGGRYWWRPGHWSSRWSEEEQEQFDEAWLDVSDTLVDEVISLTSWPWLTQLESLLPRRLPTQWTAIETLARDEQFWQDRQFGLGGLNEADRHSRLQLIFRLGVYTRTSARRQLPLPDRSPRPCSLCGEGYLEGELYYKWVSRYGTGYCTRCCHAAYRGNVRVSTTELILRAVQRLTTAIRAVPTASFRDRVIPHSYSAQVRNMVMAELVILPPLGVIYEVVSHPWLSVLQQAGVVDNSWRPSRGTYCQAADGHYCRSLLERDIDDYLSRAGIAHDVEPEWPYHADLNPNRMRADWLLADGTFVEAAGMSANREYKEKMRRKRQLAELKGIRLVVIEPEDIPVLSVLLPHDE